MTVGAETRARSLTLLTGASGMIGGAIAAQLAASHDLLLTGTRIEALEVLRSRLPRPEAHLLCAHDLASPEEAATALLAVLQENASAVEHYVHGAGLFQAGALRSLDWDDARRLFNVNFFSAVELVRQLSRKRVNGDTLRSVTFISSIAARKGFAGYHVYAASKAALNGLARSLAAELAPRVRVNSILPGPIESDATRAIYNSDAGRAAVAGIPLGAGRAEDVASLIDFLLSDKAQWITGQEFVVDGGMSIV